MLDTRGPVLMLTHAVVATDGHDPEQVATVVLRAAGWDEPGIG